MWSSQQLLVIAPGVRRTGLPGLTSSGPACAGCSSDARTDAGHQWSRSGSPCNGGRHPQQTIRIFVRAALPRAAGVSEEDAIGEEVRDQVVLGHLTTLIPRQRAAGQHSPDRRRRRRLQAVINQTVVRLTRYRLLHPNRGREIKERAGGDDPREDGESGTDRWASRGGGNGGPCVSDR